MKRKRNSQRLNCAIVDSQRRNVSVQLVEIVERMSLLMNANVFFAMNVVCVLAQRRRTKSFTDPVIAKNHAMLPHERKSTQSKAVKDIHCLVMIAKKWNASALRSRRTNTYFTSACQIKQIIILVVANMEDALWAVAKLDLRRIGNIYAKKNVSVDSLQQLSDELKANPTYAKIADVVNTIHACNVKVLDESHTKYPPSTLYLNDPITVHDMARDQLNITSAIFLLCQELWVVCQLLPEVVQPPVPEVPKTVILRHTPNVASYTLHIENMPVKWTHKNLQAILPTAQRITFFQPTEGNPLHALVKFRSPRAAADARSALQAEYEKLRVWPVAY